LKIPTKADTWVC